MNNQTCWSCNRQVYHDSSAHYYTGSNSTGYVQQVCCGNGVSVANLQPGPKCQSNWGNEACGMHTCRRDWSSFYGGNSPMSREVVHRSTDGSLLRGTDLQTITSSTNQDYWRDCHYRQAYPTSTVQYATTSEVGYVQERYCKHRPTVNLNSDASGSDALRKDLPHAADAKSYKGIEDWGNDCTISSWPYDRGSSDGSNSSTSMRNTDEPRLDGEVRKRIDQMDCIPHVPKINSRIPSADEATSDHERLLNRLESYDLRELKISGDGNCQFRALSDQLYQTSEYHKEVRQQVVDQLKANPDRYASYVPMPYNEYLEKISSLGEWGDHVTLQAAADWYGVRIFVLTSFKDTCYIEILPSKQKSERVIFMSFWAEVHYNSIYRREESCTHTHESDRRKKWWNLMAQS